MRAPRVVRDFAKDTRGNIAMMSGIGMTVVLIGVASAIDYSMASNNRHETQNMADSLALAAALQMGRDGTENLQSQRMYAEGRKYTGKELGFSLEGLHNGTDVEVEFIYDLDTNEVRTIVTGKAQASFVRFMGVDYIEFTSESVVEFPGKDLQHPASIAMVIDNSNSMWYDEDPSAPWDEDHFKNNARTVPTGLETRPSGTQQRIKSLQKAFTALNDALEDSVGDDPSQRYLRMGLIPFNHNFIGGKSSRMNWGVVPQNKINRMRPSGETDTSKGMAKANNWLKNEHTRYATEIRDDLKRYVIFMTDGHNTRNSTTRVNSPGSGLWRGQVKVERDGRWQTYRECLKYETRRRTGSGGESGPSTGTYRVCVKRSEPKKRWIPPKSYWQWREIRQTTRPTDGRNWKEIKRVDRTRKLCDDFASRGWTVFSVAYALQPGVYQRNLPGRPPQEYWGVSPDEVDEARSLLEYCATSPEHFLSANNAVQLRDAFNEIGISITNDTKMRIKS